MIDARNPIANPLNPDIGVKNLVSFRIHANDRRLLVIKLFPYVYIHIQICLYICIYTRNVDSTRFSGIRQAGTRAARNDFITLRRFQNFI